MRQKFRCSYSRPPSLLLAAAALEPSHRRCCCFVKGAAAGHANRGDPTFTAEGASTHLAERCCALRCRRACAVGARAGAAQTALPGPKAPSKWVTSVMRSPITARCSCVWVCSLSRRHDVATLLTSAACAGLASARRSEISYLPSTLRLERSCGARKRQVAGRKLLLAASATLARSAAAVHEVCLMTHVAGVIHGCTRAKIDKACTADARLSCDLSAIR